MLQWVNSVENCSIIQKEQFFFSREKGKNNDHNSKRRSKFILVLYF